MIKLEQLFVIIRSIINNYYYKSLSLSLFLYLSLSSINYVLMLKKNKIMAVKLQ